MAVRGDKSDPLFGGYTCIKGRQLADQYHSPSRLRSPLKKNPEGTFDIVNSSDALDEIAEKIDHIVSHHGPRSVATYIGTGAYQNSVGVAVGAAWHKGFDSPSFIRPLPSISLHIGVLYLDLALGKLAGKNFSNSDVLLAVGYNPLVSSYGPASGLQGTDPL